MKYEKWRELDIDPYKIEFENFKLKEIINYPYAGNDVIDCNVIFNSGECKRVVIKIERSKVSNFGQETEILEELRKIYTKIPKVYECGIFKNKMYIVLEYVEGLKLSEFIKELDCVTRMQYLEKYGEELSEIHSLNITNQTISLQRNINDIPRENDVCLEKYLSYLKNNKVEKSINTFIHGDFHYANILWESLDINAVLDWEYSGLGFKEQDIAWACILRPGQMFLDTITDIKAFLKGYHSKASYNMKKFKWCYINAGCHFYLMNKNNSVYKEKLLELMDEVMSF